MKNNTPTLRFKNDDGDCFPVWEIMELGSIAEIKLGKMLDKAKHTSGQLLPYLNNISLRWNEVDTSNLPQMYFTDKEMDRFGLKCGDVVVCEGGEPGRSAVWDGHLPHLKFQKAIHRVRFTVPFEAALLVLYLQRIVGTNRFEMLFTGGGIKHLTRETFASLKIPVPTLPEQRKIAGFLSAVDKRIQQLTQKKALLEDYKKGVMQQLFTQAIRFKDDDGKDFPDWEEKKLSEIASPLKRKNRDLQVKLVLTNSATRGVVNQRDYFDKDIANAKNIGGYYVVRNDDFVYNPRISETAPVGPIKRNHLGIGVMSPLYTVFSFQEGNKRFFEFFFQTSEWHRYMNSVANFGARHDRMAITRFDFFRLPIPFPSPEEQAKIADFLSAVDHKIESVAAQVTETQTFKRGLLQQMFV